MSRRELEHGDQEARVAMYAALEAVWPHLRSLAWKEIGDEVALSHDWQLDDPRIGYVEVQMDKDTYRQLMAARGGV